MRKGKRNQGFTLIELIVSIAIFAIIMTTVAGVLSAMSKMFSSAQKDIELQDSVQTTFSLISDLVKESQVVKVDGHENSVKLVGNDLYIYKENIDQASSDYITKVASDEATLYVVHLNTSTKKLYLYQQKYNPNSCSSSGSFVDVSVSDSDICKDENLLSKNVKNFSVKDEAANGYIVLDISLEYGSRSASIAQNVYLRNSNTTIWASDVIEDTEEVTATPTPIPTTPVEVQAQIATLAGNNYSAEKQNISSNSNIGVYYDSVENKTAHTTTVDDYTYKCGHSGCNCTNINLQKWGMQCLSWSHDQSEIRHEANTVEENIQYFIDNGYLIREKTGSHEETSYTVDSVDGRLIIRNESLTADLSNVEVVVYIQDNDASFKVLSDGINYLKTDTSLTTGSLMTTYYTSPISSGTCKYIKITIPTIKKAETYTENGEDKVKYDQYVYTFDYTDASGNKPVICTYSANAN